MMEKIGIIHGVVEKKKNLQDLDYKCFKNVETIKSSTDSKTVIVQKI